MQWLAGPTMLAMVLQKRHRHILQRLIAAELGNDKIRVNVVNPDAVIQIVIYGQAAGLKAGQKLME